MGRQSSRLLWLLLAPAAWAAELPAGQVIADVKCVSDSSQAYALYLPSNYEGARAWPVIFAFDPGGRGRVPVERYQAAAEKYGYIVAGSNNSRNGPWEVSTHAARAMFQDVSTRFHLDARQVYLAGMSGGARVALGIALGNGEAAGVIASSAGYPDSKPRKTVPFPVFLTAGTEDFNLSELRRMDRELTSAHRLAVFEGPHVWLSSELAMQAVEWMEIQAMKSGRKPRDEERIDRIFSSWKANATTFAALTSLVTDFGGLRDVSALAARAVELGRDKHVREEIRKEREEENHEDRITREILGAEARLGSLEEHGAALVELRDRWKRLAAMADAAADSADRRTARRVLRGLSMGVAERANDPQYLKIVEQYRPARGGAR